MDLPKFVSINGTTLRLDNKYYYRDGGCWSIGYRIIDGALLSWYPNRGMPWLHRKPLIEVTEKEWLEDNKYYVKDYRLNLKNNKLKL